MNIRKVPLLLFSFTFLLIATFLFVHNDQPSFASQGMLDLNKTPFRDDKMIALDGQWEFYGGHLYDPNEFTKEVRENTNWIHVPSKWSAETEKQGMGTYRLLINNVPTDQILGIKKQNIRSASKIFINGELVSEEGNVTKEYEDYLEGNYPKLIFFESDTEQVEVIIQVSDFSYNSAGIVNSIYFGQQDILMAHSFKKVTSELVILTVLLTIGLLYILLYLFVERYRRKELFILAFALSCIFFALINLCLSERTILYLLPDLSFEAMFKIKDTSIFLATISFIVILTQIDTRLFSPWIRNTLISAYTLYIMVILCTPLNVYHLLIPFFIFLNCFTYLYSMIKSSYHFIKNEQGENHLQQKIILFSIFNINIYNINLLLYSFGFTTNLQIGFINILLYAIALAILLTTQVNQSYKKNDYLSNELEMTEQAYLVAQIKPHFFFNTLTSIMSLCYTDGKRAVELLGHFSSFLRQSFDFNAKDVFVTVESELKLLKSYIAIEKARFAERLQIEYDIDPSTLTETIIPLSIQPIVENAILHGILPKEEGGVIKISVTKNDAYLIISVFDNGIGLSPEKTRNLSNPKNSTIRGIGIPNINKRLAKYYRTQLILESELGFWTRVTFKIPMNT